MTSARVDLRQLRLILAVVAILLSIIAVAPHGASAEPNTGGGTDATAGAKRDCENAGGTWTIDGSKATCTGMGWPKDYSCDLTINPNGTACSHLPKPRLAPSVRGPRGVHIDNVSVYQAPDPTPIPTYVAVDSVDTASLISPLDE